MIKRIKDLVGLELAEVSVNKDDISLCFTDSESLYHIRHDGFKRVIWDNLPEMIGHKIISARYGHNFNGSEEEHYYRIESNYKEYTVIFTRSLEGRINEPEPELMSLLDAINVLKPTQVITRRAWPECDYFWFWGQSRRPVTDCLISRVGSSETRPIIFDDILATDWYVTDLPEDSE